MNEKNENSNNDKLKLTNFGITPLEGHEMREVLRRAHVTNLEFAKFCGTNRRQWTYQVYQSRYVNSQIAKSLREFLGEEIFEAILQKYREERALFTANRKKNIEKTEKNRS